MLFSWPPSPWWPSPWRPLWRRAVAAARLQLEPSAYVMVQHLDHEAMLVGILGVLALAAAALHSFLVRGSTAAFAWSIVAVAGLAAAQIVFWSISFPIIALTQDWSVVPEDFDGVRQQWESALAVAGALCFGALLAIVRALQASRPIASLAILESIERDAAVRAARSRAQGLDGNKHQIERDVAA
ncbi:MAG: hypothetical protein WDN31_14345 [Hyphomicrobium sp.]